VTSLGALLRDVGIDSELADEADELTVSTVELDSRRCSRGSVFVCVPGTTTTGEAFVSDALARGAICVVASTPVDAPVSVLVERSSLRGVLASLSSAVVGNPAGELTLAGVTGTNGKTTVTWLLHGILSTAGFASSTIGTLTGERTTPSAPELHRELRVIADRAAASGSRGAVAMEVSSHALDQGRVDGLYFDVSVFTNLSHEHLDYHGTMERYFDAKAALFELPRSASAVICVDDEWGRQLAARRALSTIEVATTEATDVDASIGATSFTWRSRRVTTQLTGTVNVTNAMLAVAAAHELGVDDDRSVRAIAGIAPVPGRLEVVATSGPSVLVDYAHTPVALERVIGDLRSLADSRRLVVVFGCGGDKDRAKRPLMGSIATRLADEVVVTSDNPRSEDPEVIIDEVMAGADGPATIRREPDRGSAIASTIARARDDDVLLIAGKGHETAQDVAGTLVAFDDRVVARAALETRRRSC
jgi:UDP-N-acetylmuramoyl-L-alanyl-D-glutamate--2,6-diaminopimelate ligase